MKYIHYIAFVTIVIVLGWIFRPVEEHMTLGTSKNEIYGPKGIDAEKCARVYPQVYGPDGMNIQNRQQGQLPAGTPGTVPITTQPQTNGPSTRPQTSGPSTQPRTSGPQVAPSASNYDIEYPSSTNAMYEDDGEFRSDTATRNAAYMNVFTFKPYAKMDFPTSGPPQPYLSDFANFHK